MESISCYSRERERSIINRVRKASVVSNVNSDDARAIQKRVLTASMLCNLGIDGIFQEDRKMNFAA